MRLFWLYRSFAIQDAQGVKLSSAGHLKKAIQKKRQVIKILVVSLAIYTFVYRFLITAQLLLYQMDLVKYGVHPQTYLFAGHTPY